MAVVVVRKSVRGEGGSAILVAHLGYEIGRYIGSRGPPVP